MNAGRVGARGLLDRVLDPGWTSWDEPPAQPAEPGSEYATELAAARERSGCDEAVLTGAGLLRGHRVAFVVSEFGFLAGSIGTATADRIVAAVRRATAERLPLLAAPSSGGTRMQEGTAAFVQMARITAAVMEHRAAGLPYLVYLRHPATGGVLASWGSLGHVTAAEPGALIGFLGPRVYEALHGEPFPPGVQVAEHLYARGLIDAVVGPDDVAGVADQVLTVLSAGTQAGPRRAGDGTAPPALRVPQDADRHGLLEPVDESAPQGDPLRAHVPPEAVARPGPAVPHGDPPRAHVSPAAAGPRGSAEPVDEAAPHGDPLRAHVPPEAMARPGPAGAAASADPSSEPAPAPGGDAPPASAWESVGRSRRDGRPGVRELLRYGARDVTPLSGTGAGEADPGLLLALARFGTAPCVVVGQDRRDQRAGHLLGPAGLRVARRGMGLAAELGLPLLTVVDTPGAALSAEAEEGGLAGEIARCLADLMTLAAPTLCLLLGEGTGGAALALLPADRVLCARHAWLSPLPPEGASVIVHRTTARAADLAEAQRIGSADLLRTGVADRLVPEHPDAADEPEPFCHRTAAILERELTALHAAPAPAPARRSRFTPLAR
ncbi:acetyl-CoA carboxyl transferase [Actinomadura craniellae]|uniref:Acetyl-coenzyme A carboxylase carboxyl transferase subunits beta/alpha n=1 Tax=Actinomadura craniellae TaxID=2231787 RepID=A0A365H1X8_9ACTN|nr:carboxyl transferase domain-containing protein [Actinomadura craniellae]RAY13002.1 acetyl-CoA carboxyl transferase [Actinomadura craniellae]